MTQDLVIGIYVAAVGVSIIIYVFMVRKICKSENLSLGEAFGFSKGDDTWKPKAKHTRAASSSFSVKERIDELTQEALGSNNGAERRKLLDQIRELESQR